MESNDKTQTAAAQKLGVSVQYLNNIICGRARPSWSAAKELAEGTGSDPVVWMEGTPTELRQIIEGMK